MTMLARYWATVDLNDGTQDIPAGGLVIADIDLPEIQDLIKDGSLVPGNWLNLLSIDQNGEESIEVVPYENEEES